ncbi:MAG: Uma2 family endonuclease [Planctomycetota bacterium]
MITSSYHERYPATASKPARRKASYKGGASLRADLKITYAEYRALPETGPRYQLIEGDLVMSPAPSFFHQRLSGRLYRSLGTFVAEHRLGEVLYAPLDLILDEENVLQPDLVFIAASQENIIAPEGLRGAPALCVEILSPRTSELDTGIKRRLYARFGVEEYWLVSPEEKRIYVYRLQENASAPAKILGLGDTLTSALFPGWAMRLEEFFAE